MANIPLSSRRHSLPENIFSALKLYVITDVQCALRERSLTQIVLAQIALHVAFSYPGAQFYIGCAQVKIVSIIQSRYRLLVLIRPIVFLRPAAAVPVRRQSLCLERISLLTLVRNILSSTTCVI